MQFKDFRASIQEGQIVSPLQMSAWKKNTVKYLTASNLIYEVEKSDPYHTIILAKRKLQHSFTETIEKSSDFARKFAWEKRHILFGNNIIFAMILWKCKNYCPEVFEPEGANEKKIMISCRKMYLAFMEMIFVEWPAFFQEDVFKQLGNKQPSIKQAVVICNQSRTYMQEYFGPFKDEFPTFKEIPFMQNMEERFEQWKSSQFAWMLDNVIVGTFIKEKTSTKKRINNSLFFRLPQNASFLILKKLLESVKMSMLPSNKVSVEEAEAFMMSVEHAVVCL